MKASKFLKEQGYTKEQLKKYHKRDLDLFVKFQMVKISRLSKSNMSHIAFIREYATIEVLAVLPKLMVNVGLETIGNAVYRYINKPKKMNKYILGFFDSELSTKEYFNHDSTGYNDFHKSKGKL